MVGEVTTTEGRRFTAIGLRHSSLRSEHGRLSVLQACVRDLRSAAISPSTWQTYRGARYRKSSLYPDNHIDPDAIQSADGEYQHDLFFAVSDRASVGPTLWIASPYIQLLNEVHDHLIGQLGRSTGLRYVGVDIKRFYSILSASTNEEIAARRVILRIVGEDNVELVSLTGKNPLHSQIHDDLENSTLPFGVGADVKFMGLRCRVTVDQNGYFHWFQSTLPTMACWMHLVDQLGDSGILEPTHLYPLSAEAKKQKKPSGDVKNG